MEKKKCQFIFVEQDDLKRRVHSMLHKALHIFKPTNKILP